MSLPNVSIIKMEDTYQFVGILGGSHLSLGAYKSLQEGVCSILENGNAKIIFLTQLESLWRKGVEFGWDEAKLFEIGSCELERGSGRSV